MVDVFGVAADGDAFVGGDAGVDGVGGAEGVDEGFEVGEGFAVARLEGRGVALRRGEVLDGYFGEERGDGEVIWEEGRGERGGIHKHRYRRPKSVPGSNFRPSQFVHYSH